MARNTAPKPDPLPSAGGSYLLDSATGKWVLQSLGESPSAAAEADPVITNEDGTDTETPTAGGN